MAHSIQYVRIMNSKRWHDLQAYTLRAKPFCERCETKGKRTLAKVVHHIRPIESGHSQSEYESLAFDPDNLQALCHQCHSDIHRHELGSYGKDGHKRRESDRLKRWINDHSPQAKDNGDQE